MNTSQTIHKLNSEDIADLIRGIKTNEISLQDAARRLQEDGKMRCNCDLDNWEPERSTGHSCVCRIHKMATGLKLRPHDFKAHQS
jgi:hypothetical protein